MHHQSTTQAEARAICTKLLAQVAAGGRRRRESQWVQRSMRDAADHPRSYRLVAMNTDLTPNVAVDSEP
jgi:hypothetical protein